MTTPITVPAQIQDNGSGSASTNTPTSSTIPTLPGGHGGPDRDRERVIPVANMTPSMATMVFDSASPGGSTTQTGGKAVKRPRPVKSCNSCRQRKLRCDRSCPCSQCLKSSRPCQYATESEPAHGGSEGSEAEVSPRPAKRQYRAPQPAHTDASSHTHAPAIAGDEYARGSSAAVMEQFGARLERLERLVLAGNNTGNPNANNSSYAPSWHSATGRELYSGYGSVAGAPTTIRGLSVKGNLRTRFFGQNSSRVLLNLFDEAREFLFSKSGGSSDDIHDLFVQLHKIHKTISEDHRRALTPISVFTDSLLPVQKRMADILPNKAICDRLLDAYITVSEGLYRVIHVPTFRAEYETFWQQHQQQGGLPHLQQRGPVSEAFLPRLLCMLSLGARFDTEKRGLSQDRSDGIHAPTACVLARAWLDSLRGKQLVDLETLQCEVLLLHATRMVSSRNQESWTQLGFIVRMAMTMGLHRDPDEFPQLQLRPFYAELRRRLWYTIMDMDLHVALACNLPCAVREGEFTCRPPRNLDDLDIHPDMRQLPPSKPIDEPTSTQLQAYASRTLHHRIRVASIINRLDTLRDFNEVLDCGAQLERLLDDVNHLFPRARNTALLNPAAKFKEWRMRALLDMHVRRPLLALYRPFALSTVDCPASITSSYLKSSMVMLTYMDELDPSMVGFTDVSAMYHVVMKHDILQAAFSVCYFIKGAQDEERTRLAMSNGQLPPSPSMLQRHHHDLGGGMVWSAQGMTRAVSTTLDSFVTMVKDSSCDLKDTVVLSVVLNSVLGGGVEERANRIREGVAKIVEKCLVALGTSVEGLGAMPMSGPSTPLDPYVPQGMQQQQYGPATFFEDFSFWDMDQWDLSSMPMGMN